MALVAPSGIVAFLRSFAEALLYEAAYSQKRKKLERLAGGYLLDSNASVQVVIGLDIEYGKKGSRRATYGLDF
jgi:hypothetical protein